MTISLREPVARQKEIIFMRSGVPQKTCDALLQNQEILRLDHPSLRITMFAALNRSFKRWPEIFNNDATLTSALLDRLLHHAEVVLIEGPSYRAKDLVEAEPS
jgi:DNA replication protein DnaC